MGIMARRRVKNAATDKQSSTKEAPKPEASESKEKAKKGK